MSIEITGETEAWTDIVWKNANGETLFEGCLAIEPDEWVLKELHVNGYFERVHSFAIKRSYLSALKASLDWIEKNKEQQA